MLKHLAKKTNMPPSNNTQHLIKKHALLLKLLTGCFNRMTKHGNMSYRLGLEKNITLAEVEKQYAIWLYLVERLEHPIEKEFFNENWLKVGNIYVDLSKKELPMFYADFMMLGDGSWYTQTIAENSQDFSKKLDNDEIDIAKHFDNLKIVYAKKENLRSNKYKWGIYDNYPLPSNDDYDDVIFFD